jgi:asparagine synthetase B (glutamine-hydrolysing)
VVRQLSPVERWLEWLPAGASPHARSVLQTVYHPAHPLRYECTTKLTALYGVESLQPFLDCDLIAFLATIPGEVHTRAGLPKAILRDSLAELLPRSLLSRTDKGDYTEPIRDGIVQNWSRYANRIASSECAFDWHILERRRVQEKLARLEQHRQIDLIAASWELLDLYGLVVWLELFYGAGKVPSSRRQYERVNAEARP